MDKRERRRIERARLRKGRSRNEAQQREAASRQARGWDHLAAAEQAFAARAYGEAAQHAARAAALRPRDEFVATLYADAAERSRDALLRSAALEHLIRVVGPTFEALASLADAYRATGNLARAGDLAAQARRILPRLLRHRRQWIALLEEVEAAAGSATRAAQAPAHSAQQETLPFGPAAEAPAPAATPTAGVEDMPPAPAPPSSFTIPVTILGDILGLDALSGTADQSLDDVTLTLRATELRDAESFDRLLSLEHAQGLIRLSHQEETARKVLAVFLGRALLADEVGLGKTIEAGLVLSEYLLRGRVQNALVLVPPSLVGQWREELAAKFAIATHSSDDREFRSDPLRLWTESGVIVASLATARAERHRAAVTSRSWDLVIVDEAHTVKNHRTESYALVEHLQSRFLLLLTATPVENRVAELYNLVSLIRPGHLGGRAAFVKRFATAGGQIAEAARSEIRTLLSELMIRNTRALSGVHLPPRFARTLLVEPGPEEHALYEHLAAALRSLGTAGRARMLLSTLLQEAGSSPWAVRGTLEKVAADDNVPAGVRRGLMTAADFARQASGSEKGRTLLQALQPAAGPTVVFTRFRGTLAFLAEVLAHAGIAHEQLHGGVPPTERAAAIARCRNGGGVLLSTDVGSEGLNLQFCHRLINFDLPWNPMRIEQRIGRLHRIGQEHAVEVLSFCLAGSIEERILRILDERINLFELVVGEVEMILGYLDTAREFPDIVLDAFAEPEEESRTRSFARIADALAAARERYRAVKSFDEALFRNELGV